MTYIWWFRARTISSLAYEHYFLFVFWQTFLYTSSSSFSLFSLLVSENPDSSTQAARVSILFPVTPHSNNIGVKFGRHFLKHLVSILEKSLRHNGYGLLNKLPNVYHLLGYETSSRLSSDPKPCLEHWKNRSNGSTEEEALARLKTDRFFFHHPCIARNNMEVVIQAARLLWKMKSSQVSGRHNLMVFLVLRSYSTGNTRYSAAVKDLHRKGIAVVEITPAFPQGPITLAGVDTGDNGYSFWQPKTGVVKMKLMNPVVENPVNGSHGDMLSVQFNATAAASVPPSIAMLAGGSLWNKKLLRHDNWLILHLFAAYTAQRLATALPVSRSTRKSYFQVIN